MRIKGGDDRVFAGICNDWAITGALYVLRKYTSRKGHPFKGYSELGQWQTAKSD